MERKLTGPELAQVKPRFREVVIDAWEQGEDVPWGVIALDDRSLTEYEQRRALEIAEDLGLRATETDERTAHYLRQRYPIEVMQLAEEDGGGWLARIPQLGNRTFVAVEETPRRALRALEALKQHLIPELIAAGTALPDAVDPAASPEAVAATARERTDG